MEDEPEYTSDSDIQSNTDAIIGSVVADNLKTVAGAGAFYAAQGMRAHVEHANRLNLIAENTLAYWAKKLHETGVTEAVSSQKLLSGNDLAQQLTQLLSVVNSGQQQVKAAQTTPPVTS
jgi:hypothetical protein